LPDYWERAFAARATPGSGSACRRGAAARAAGLSTRSKARRAASRTSAEGSLKAVVSAGLAAGSRSQPKDRAAEPRTSAVFVTPKGGDQRVAEAGALGVGSGGGGGLSAYQR
jgi:hypothetical protein